ncbi:MAG: HAD family phosphatase [Alistipes sp.]|nr:HAD family phosphatase [Candidatus Alistipes equi]
MCIYKDSNGNEIELASVNLDNIKLILLDFDGTLVNTGRANAVSYCEALEEEGIHLTLESYRERYFGWRCPEFLHDLGIDSNEDVKRIRQRKIDIYPTHFDLISLNESLWNFVLEFKKRGGNVAIVSTGHPSNLRNAMDHVGITHLIDKIYTSDCVKRSKPFPDCFLLAMNDFQATFGQTLIFEDSQVGLEAASRSGATYIQVSLPF